MASDHATVSPADGSEPAPWLQIPTRAIAVVEHPCIVKHVDKGIASLGGPVTLSQGLRCHIEPTRNTEGEDELPGVIAVSLRPDDPLAKRVLSTTVTTNNLLLRVTVPKRTGRKRKRGSSAPFVGDEKHQDQTQQNTHVPASSILRRLQDNPARYTVAVAGLIDETHRFRTLPDLQYAASTNKTMGDLRDHFLSFNYEKMKNYKFNTAGGADLTRDVGPSACFIQMPVAYNYKFTQNTNVKYTGEEGEINIQRGTAYKNYSIIKPDAETVPTRPKSTLPAESELTPYMQSLIASIRLELQKRPIITRHLLYNTLGWDKRQRLRQAALYCGYFFESGPWREALITWGVDPRKDPRFRHYQTVSFLSYLKTGTPRHFTAFDRHVQELARKDTAVLKNQHMFDGVTVSSTGNIFQFCDITDPLIRKILDTNDIRETCALTSQGWYHSGTWAKATVILKDKMNRIIGGEKPDNSLYDRIITWPELWDDQEIHARYRSEFFNKRIHRERLQEHNLMRSVRWAARNPRYAFEKMEAAAAQADAQASEENPEDEEMENGEAQQQEEEKEEEEVPEDLTEEPDTALAILNEDDDGEEEGDGDGDEEEDDEGDADGVMDEDIDAEGETDDEQVSQRQRDGSQDSDDGIEPAERAGTEGPLPFGGLYKT